MVVAGGVIQDDDCPALRQMGIKEIFGPGTPTQSIVDFIKKALTEGAT